MSAAPANLSKRLAIGVIGLGYILLLVLVTLAIFQARDWSQRTFGSESAQADWEAWKAEAKESSETGPVRRRVGDSRQPPLAILFQDHFVVMLLGGLVFTSLIYAAICWLTYGSIFGGSRS